MKSIVQEDLFLQDRLRRVLNKDGLMRAVKNKQAPGGGGGGMTDPHRLPQVIHAACSAQGDHRDIHRGCDL